jgi:hypothetical protein
VYYSLAKLEGHIDQVLTIATPPDDCILANTLYDNPAPLWNFDEWFMNA